MDEKVLGVLVDPASVTIDASGRVVIEDKEFAAALEKHLTSVKATADPGRLAVLAGWGCANVGYCP